MSPAWARARTTGSGGERTKHEATVPPYNTKILIIRNPFPDRAPQKILTKEIIRVYYAVRRIFSIVGFIIH